MSRNIYCIGSYTEVLGHVPQGCGEGLYIISQDRDSGHLTLEFTTGGIKNPSWVHWDKERQTLYSITENEENGGEIASYKYSESNGLVETGRVNGSGRASCHLLTHSSQNLLFTSSYSDGSMAAYALNGSLPGELIRQFRYTGHGPLQDRQEGPHAHQLCMNTDETVLYVCDLGSDRIRKHDLISSDLHQGTALKVLAGYGPRHMVVDSQSPLVFILCELQPKLLAARILQTKEVRGDLEILEEHDTVDSSQMSTAAPAAIKIHPSGRTVYVSNRFTDSLSVFEINRTADSPILKKVDEFSTRGKTPRDFSFSPDGRWLLIANQDSSDIQCCRIDSDSGLPRDEWTPALELGTPVCIAPLSD